MCYKYCVAGGCCEKIYGSESYCYRHRNSMSAVVPSTASSYLVSLANEAYQNGKNVFEFKIEIRDGYEKISYNYGRWNYEKSTLRR